MLSLKEYKFLLTLIFIISPIYYVLLHEIIDGYQLLLLIAVVVSTIKSLYDIKNQSGDLSIYRYSSRTNFLMRMGAFVILFCLCIFYHYIVYRQWVGQ